MDFDSKHIDEVFREKFENFEVIPPESLWEKIKAGLSGGSSGTLFSNPITLASMAAIILIALMVGLNFMKQPDKAMMFLLEGPHASSRNIQEPDNKKAIPAPIDNQIAISGEQEEGIAEATPSQNAFQGPQTSFGKQFKDPEPERQQIEYEALGRSEIRLSQGLTPVSPVNRGLIDNERNLKRTVVLRDDYIRKNKPQWTLGAYFTPEVVIYPNDNVQNQSAYHFDFSAALNFSDFFIESGIGLNFSKDDGAYKYDYEKYLGTYDDVYLVTFDSTENGVIPTYYTQPVDVYDSIREVFRPTKNRYTYIEIPVLFGLRKQVDRLGWFVKAGPAIDVLVSESKADAGQADKDRFTLIENEQPKRVNAYWQMMFSAGVSYRVSKNFSLAFEPVFRYYIQSGYERTYMQSKHPYAIGVRAGIVYNF